MNIQFLLMTTEAYHSTRCEYVRSSWGKGQNLLFFTDTEVDGDKSFIKVSDNKEWSSNVEKGTKALVYADDNLDADYYFFGCEDRYVFVDSLERFLKEKDSNEPESFGKISTMHPNFRVGYHDGGGVVYSREALKIIAHQIRRINPIYDPINNPACDFYLGRLARDQWAVDRGLKVIHSDLFHTHPPWVTNRHRGFRIFDGDPQTWDQKTKDHICFHYISSREDFDRMIKIEGEKG